MQARMLEPRPILERFTNLLEQMMATRFAEEGEGDWPELAPKTIERKGHSIIGRETDAMMQALTTSGAEGALREVIDDELIFGVNLTSEEGVPYPAIFNDGRRAGPEQPPRPLFNPESMNLRRFTKEIQAWIVGQDRSQFGAPDFRMSSLTFP